MAPFVICAMPTANPKTRDKKGGMVRPMWAAWGFLLFLLVLTTGTVGYMILEGWSLLDALYMTVILITTVGYGEIKEVSDAGRIFSMVVIFSGMGIIAYIAGTVAQSMVEVRISALLGRRRLGLKVKSMKEHYIICGYGRIGRIIAHELQANAVPFLVVESNSDLRQNLEHSEFPFIIDDATNEDVLLEAGIERARGLVAVVVSDADNLFITMTARGLNPQLFIVARAEDEKNQKKLQRAGANRVVLPYLIGGQKMAHTIVKPAVTDFLELTVHDKSIELKMEELVVRPGSRLNGVALMDSGLRHGMNVLIVAILKQDGKMMFNPSSQTRIEEGDTLIALGEQSDLDKLDTLLAGQ